MKIPVLYVARPWTTPKLSCFRCDRPSFYRITAVVPDPGYVSLVEASPDNTLVASVEDYSLKIRRAGTLHLQAGPTIVSTEQIKDLKFSPNGRRLAVVCKNGEWIVYDTASWAILARNKRWPINSTISIEYSPNGSFLAIGFKAASYLLVIDTVSGELMLSGQGVFTNNITGVSWSPSGDQLAVTSLNSPFFRRFSTTTWLSLSDPAVMPKGQGRSVRFSPDGTMLAIGYRDSPFFHIYNVSDWSVITGPSSDAMVTSLAWSPDSSRLAVGRNNYWGYPAVTNSLQVWTTTAWTMSNVPLKGSTDQVLDLSWSPDGNILAVASDGNTSYQYIQLLQVSDWSFLSGPTQPNYWVWAVRWAIDGGRLAIGGWFNENFIVYQVSSWNILSASQSPPSTNSSEALAWYPDGSRIAIGLDSSPYLMIYNTATWTLDNLSQWPLLSMDINGCAFSPDETKLSLGSKSYNTANAIWVYELSTGNLLHVQDNNENLTRDCFDVAWSHDGGKLAALYDSGIDTPRCIVYNVGTWERLSNKVVYGVYSSIKRKLLWDKDDSRIIMLGDDSIKYLDWPTLALSTFQFEGSGSIATDLTLLIFENDPSLIVWSLLTVGSGNNYVLNSLGKPNNPIQNAGVNSVSLGWYDFLAASIKAPFDIGILSGSSIVQPFKIGSFSLGSLHQIFNSGILCASKAQQPWSNSFLGALKEPYKHLLSETIYQPYSHENPLGGSLVQPWEMALLFKKSLSQQYNTLSAIKGSIQQIFDVLNTNPCKKSLVSRWSIGDLTSRLINQTASIIIGGATVPLLAAEIGIDDAGYAWTGTVELGNLSDYLLLHINDQIVLDLNGDQYQMVIDSTSIDRSGSQPNPTIRISMISPTARFASPRAKPMTKTWATAISARDVVEELAGSGVVWEIVNWTIAAGRLVISAQPPIQIIQQIAIAAGGVVTTNPNGSLRIRPLFPVSPPSAFKTATPDHIFTDAWDILSVNEELGIMTHYNNFLVSDGDGVSGKQDQLDQTRIDLQHTRIRAWLSPWRAGVTLVHTGSPEVEIFSKGEQSEELTEMIEFVRGAASVSKPIDAIISLDWKTVPLSPVVASPGQTGIKAGDEHSFSFAKVFYKTRFLEWIVFDEASEPVQFLLQEDEL